MDTFEDRQQYLWRFKDELGRGATASVYKARNKVTGNLVAAKVFNNSRSSSNASGRREFDVLQRLKHKNIVAFLDVDQQAGRNFVLIMEYCAGGSLYDVLEKPENAYGLDEAEFLSVVRDVSEGVRYLRKENIVHRDIKPGNIMRAIDLDGSSIYKVSDFGAARTLDDGENFKSLCGTEEYLHPAMYAAAVMHVRGARNYTAKVDLWSLGCTFYHAATGRLPFRPKGGRQNARDMGRMTGSKPVRAIAASTDENGAIQYEYNLPDTCRLTDGLQELVLQMLQGLIEINERHQMDFEQLFQLVNYIQSCHVLHVFSATHATTFTLYSAPNDTLNKFLDDVARRTDFHASTQRIFHEGTPLRSLVTETDPLSSYPGTTQTQPFILLSDKEVDQGFDYPRPRLPQFKKVNVGLCETHRDYPHAKHCLGLMHLHKRCAASCLLHAELLEKSAEIYTHTVRVETEKAKTDFAAFLSELDELFNHVMGLHTTHAQNKQLGLQVDAFTERLRANKRKIDQVYDNSRKCSDHLDALVARLSDGKTSLRDGKPFVQKIRKLKGPEKVQQLIKSTEQMLPELRHDRDYRDITGPAKQVHRFNMHSLVKNCESAKDFVERETISCIEEVFRFFLQWFTVAQKQAKKAVQLNKNVSWSINRKKKVSEEFSTLRSEYARCVDAQLSDSAVPSLLSAATGFMSSVPPQFPSNLMTSQTLGDSQTLGSSRTLADSQSDSRSQYIGEVEKSSRLYDDALTALMKLQAAQRSVITLAQETNSHLSENSNLAESLGEKE